MESMEADDALLGDLLALLEGCPEEVIPTVPAPPIKSVVSDGLAQARRSPRQVAMERALTERRKRQRAEQECEMLREAVYKHTRFVRGLDAMLSFRPRFSLRLNLCRYLHRHIVLPRNRAARHVSLEAASQDARMQLAMDVLCHETATLSLSEEDASPALASTEPRYLCETVDDGCGNNSVTQTSVYTIDTKDLGAVVRGVCVAIRDIVTFCPFGHSFDVADDVVDADVPSERNVLYRVVSLNHLVAHDDKPIRLQTHVLVSYKMTDDYAVVLYDYIDEDELHPKPEATEISREATGACLIRREVCSDGVERTVLRSLCTKRFRFLDDDVSRRYNCANVQSSYANESLFRQIVQDQVAMEEAVVATLVGAGDESDK